MKKCPYCAEEIQDEAIVCRYCGRDLTPAATPQAPATPAKKKTRKTTVVIVVLILLILFLCWLVGITGGNEGEKSSPGQANDTEGIQTAAFETALAELQAGQPTNTPQPTITPLPTYTSTPPPQPITLSGQGDAVVDVDKWDGPALFRATYNGVSNFAITNYGANSEYYDLLVNTIGAYSGTSTIDFFEGQITTRFEISASGPWEIQIMPFTPDYVRRAEIPGTIQGIGDDVVVIGGGNPDLLIVDASTANSNFVVYGWTSVRRELLVNEIAPYSGTVLVNPETMILEIEAEGNWTLDVTTN